MKSQNLILGNIMSAFFLFLYSITGFSQDWPKIYGDEIRAYGREVLEDYDKGYLICGSILKDASHFKYGWLIKADINGNVLWDKKIGDPSVENFFLDFERTNEDGLVLSGGTAQEDIERDPLFIKLDPCGEIEWCKIYLSAHDNTAPGIISLPDGSFIGMLQYYGGDAQHIRISLVKMAADGEPIWIKHLANEDSTLSNEEPSYLNLTSDGNYLVSGYCFSPNLKPFFIKADTSGEQIWDIRWPYGSGSFAGQSVFSSNNMIYNATHLQFPGHPKVPYLIKFSESGNIIDQYPMMGDTIINGGANSLLLFDNTSLFSGTTWTNDPNYEDFYSDLIKIDTLGNLLLQRHLIQEDYPPRSIIKTFDNKIIVIGYYYVDSNWDIYMWKMNQNLEDDTLYTQPLTYDSLCLYEIQSDTVALDCSLFVNIDELPTKEQYESSIKISPNPARDWVALTLPDVIAPGAVELSVYNILGKEEIKTKVSPFNRMISLSISSLSPGMHLVVCKDQKNRILTEKLIIKR